MWVGRNGTDGELTGEREQLDVMDVSAEDRRSNDSREKIGMNESGWSRLHWPGLNDEF